MSSQMDLTDCLGRQRREICSGIPAVVVGADKDIVDVAENTAARALSERAVVGAIGAKEVLNTG